MSQTFIIDCPTCKAKVAATEEARAERSGFDEERDEPHAYRIQVGVCSGCNSFLVGESKKIGFEDFDSHSWSDVVRVFPKPPKIFSSNRIPRTVRDSLAEADRTLQAGANMATCVMLGRALEAVCRDVLKPDAEQDAGSSSDDSPKRGQNRIMLAQGIKDMHRRKIIDDRLLDWSQHLHWFRNQTAHPEDVQIFHGDAADLQAFANAIVEYIYDLADRYEEFKKRVERRDARKETATK